MKFGQQLVASLLGATLLAAAGCSRSNEAPTTAQDKKSSVPRDPCALLRPEELERIMGERPLKSLPNENTGGGFTISQCDFAMAVANDSISVSVTRSAPGAEGRDPKSFIEERIADYEKRNDTRGKSEEDKGLDFVPGLGDKALWMGTMVGGNLYVLKDHLLICIAIGSSKEPTTRKEKTIALARLLLPRL